MTSVEPCGENGTATPSALRYFKAEQTRQQGCAATGYRQARKHADRWLDRALAEPDSERVVAMAAHWWAIAEAQERRMNKLLQD